MKSRFRLRVSVRKAQRAYNTRSSTKGRGSASYLPFLLFFQTSDGHHQRESGIVISSTFFCLSDQLQLHSIKLNTNSISKDCDGSPSAFQYELLSVDVNKDCGIHLPAFQYELLMLDNETSKGCGVNSPVFFEISNLRIVRVLLRQPFTMKSPTVDIDTYGLWRSCACRFARSSLSKLVSQRILVCTACLFRLPYNSIFSSRNR